jgi:hypothetical protein
MSQPIQLSGLNALLGQSPQESMSTEQLGQMLEAMELEGKSFADLLNTEFAQFLDDEQLHNLQDNPELLQEMNDTILPLMALLGGKELPLQQLDPDMAAPAGVQRELAMLQKVQQLMAGNTGADADKLTGTPMDELASMLNMENADDSEPADEFFRQLQMLAGKQQNTSSLMQQAVPQQATEPLMVNTGLTPAQNTGQTNNLQPVPPTQTVQTPPGQQGWDAQVGQRLIWMVSNEMKSAEIRLNPAELGPMEVKVKTEGEKVSVVINVQNPQVREAIEQSLPRLREMFAGQGMDLGNVDVGQHGFAQGQGREETGQLDTHASGYGQDINEEADQELDDRQTVSGQGMVDVYI